MDYKVQLDNLILEVSSNKELITKLKNELYYKDNLLNNCNLNTFDENIRNDNFAVLYDIQSKNKNKSKETSITNIETIKEIHMKEINKYKEIIKQKEIEIIRIKNENERQKSYGNKNDINEKEENIYELRKMISDLKKENSELILQLGDYEDLKAEIEYLYKRGGNYSFKEINRTALKLAYDSLIEENKQLKDKINQLQKMHY